MRNVLKDQVDLCRGPGLVSGPLKMEDVFESDDVWVVGQLLQNQDFTKKSNRETICLLVINFEKFEGFLRVRRRGVWLLQNGSEYLAVGAFADKRHVVFKAGGAVLA